MSFTNKYYPDFAIHPGLTVKECFDEKGITAEEFAARYALSVEDVKAAVSLKGGITQEMSDCLDKWLGTNSGVFNRLQEHYDEVLKRIKFQSIPYQNRWTVVKKSGRKRLKK